MKTESKKARTKEHKTPHIFRIRNGGIIIPSVESLQLERTQELRGEREQSRDCSPAEGLVIELELAVEDGFDDERAVFGVASDLGHEHGKAGGRGGILGFWTSLAMVCS